MARDRNKQLSPEALAREQRRQETAKLYLKGWTMQSIGDRQGVSKTTVHKDVKRIIAQWQKDTATDIDKAKAVILAKLNQLEVTYWEAWDKSRQKKTIQQTKGIPSGDGDKAQVTEIQKRVEERDGDSAFLNGVQWCIEMRCRILGIYAPTKVAATTPDGKGVSLDPFLNWPLSKLDDEIRTLENRISHLN